MVYNSLTVKLIMSLGTFSSILGFIHVLNVIFFRIVQVDIG